MARPRVVRRVMKRMIVMAIMRVFLEMMMWSLARSKQRPEEDDEDAGADDADVDDKFRGRM